MKPPIETSTPIASDRGVRNLTGVSLYIPVSFSRSGDTWISALAFPSGRLAFSAWLDRGKSPILCYRCAGWTLEWRVSICVFFCSGGLLSAYVAGLVERRSEEQPNSWFERPSTPCRASPYHDVVELDDAHVASGRGGPGRMMDQERHWPSSSPPLMANVLSSFCLLESAMAISLSTLPQHLASCR